MGILDAFLPLSSASTKYRYPSETRLNEPKAGEIETALSDVDQFVSDVKQYLMQADFKSKLTGPR